MEPDLNQKQTPSQKIKSWQLILIFIVSLVGLIILFPGSEFLTFFLLFSPLVLFLLFSVRTVSVPRKKPAVLRNIVSILGILAIQCSALLLEFVSFINIGGESPVSPKVYLTFSLIFPVVIWITYYTLKKKISPTLLIITGIPAVIAILIFQLFKY